MRQKTIKKYTVNTINVDAEGKNYKVFTNLVRARNYAKEQFRSSNFVSLLNFKRIPLPI